MKKLILIILIAFCFSIPARANIIEDDKAAHLFAGSFLEEHLKAKNIPPLERFMIITGVSVIKELFDRRFEFNDIAFAICGIGFSFTLTEIGDFIEENILQEKTVVK